jgi:hypothetical protein
MKYTEKSFTLPASAGATTEKNWDRAFLSPESFEAKYGEMAERVRKTYDELDTEERLIHKETEGEAEFYWPEPSLTPNGPTEQEPFLHDLTAHTLLNRAVRGARDRRSRKGVKHLRWVAVMDLFALGSGYSKDLCRKFGLDPDEEVSR